ncbi:MAG TPA: hypothetical protein VGS07_13540 [Thermoanaerobaculia bacterium]|jgi:hypothetical protein|nr:hypothetical protein [Thermoanaerobaculia bacterium]
MRKKDTILWVVNFDSGTLWTRAKIRGTITGLEEHFLFVNPSDARIAQALVQYEEVQRVFIVYHPPESESRADDLPGDVELPEIALHFTSRLKKILDSERRLSGGEASIRLSVVAKLLANGEIIVRAKRLRQELKSGESSSSYLFNRLAEIAAPHTNDSLEDSIDALAIEFERDRGPLFLAWQKLASRLCALDLDLCALSRLLKTDYEIGNLRAAEYLREMLQESGVLRQYLKNSLTSDVAEIAREWGDLGLPDLGPIHKLLDALSAISLNSPAGILAQDAKGLMGLVEGPLGFNDSHWKLSRYFSQLAR